MYQDVLLLIDNAWTRAASGKVLEVVNPATGETMGRVAHAGVPDLDRAVAAAARGFAVWRRMPAMDRAKVMRRAAALVRERADEIARLMTLEQGKPLAEAQAEVVRGAD